MSKRYLEIDIIKGVSVVLMVFFHVFYLMNNMGFNKPDSSSGFLKSIASISHLTFITVAGINFYLSFKDKNNKDQLNKTYYFKKIKRALLLLGFGMVITFITQYVFGSNKSVKFGILHFMSVAIMISSMTLWTSQKVSNKKTFDTINSFLTICVVALLMFMNYKSKSKTIQSICQSVPFLCFIVGIYGSFNWHIGSLDHHSVISKYPYFGAGMLIGKLLYGNNSKQLIDLEKYKDNWFVKTFAWLGKNSLNIYLIHWFVLYGIIYLCGGRPQK